MLRIVTDTGSDITFKSAGSLGMESAELDIKFEEFSYDIRNDTDFSVFYDNLVKAKNLPTTSQVTPAKYLDIFNDAREKGDEVLVITLSGGLSGTYQSAVMAQEECEYDGITVIDSRQAIIPQRILAEHAVKLRDQNNSRAFIEQAILKLRDRLTVCGVLDTLTYLKKGGRVPPAMALIGNALNIKPVILLKDGILEPLGKVRGMPAGKRALWNQFEKDGYDESWPVYFGHTNNAAVGEGFMKETIAKYGLNEEKCLMYPVGGVIGTHLGPDAVVISYMKKDNG
jgi:DegV family protein with EDD domain